MTAGILLLDKQHGLSSAQALSQVKRALKPKRIGHAGTLDPLATGLLVCLIDGATRLAQYAEGGTKIYSGVFRFGIVTSTDDIEGAILSEQPATFSDAELQATAQKFVGTLEQIPPQVSAIKVNGVRAYEMARRNETVALAARKVEVESCTVERIDAEHARFIIRCSKGTYIRSIARDMGEMLGCGGAIKELRRDYSAPFSVTNAVTVNLVSAGAILPWEAIFPGAPRLSLKEAEVQALAGGDQRFLNAKLMTPEIEHGLVARKNGSAVLLYGAEKSSICSGILDWNGAELRLGMHLC